MPFADHLAIFRYADQPGMIGRVGNAFGEHGVNIVSAAVGAEASGEEAVMALTTDAPVPRARDRRDRSRATGSSSGAPSTSVASDRLDAMRAVVITRHGGPEVLEVQERPDPPVGPGEVRIAVKAAGINFADLMARSGVYPDAPHAALRGRLRGRRRGRERRRGRRRSTRSATG